MNRQTRLRKTSMKIHEMHKTIRRIASQYPNLRADRGKKVRRLTLFNALIKQGDLNKYLNIRYGRNSGYYGMTGGHNV